MENKNRIMSNVVSLINHKGGVGKTTITFNLGYALAKEDLKVLLIDSDPQGNLSQCFNVTRGTSLLDFYNEINDDPIVITENIHLLRSDLELEEAEQKLNSKKVFREGVLRKLLQKKEYDKTYDLILIDCPPSLNIITTNAMVASEGLIIPVKPEFLPYKGVGSINTIIEEIRDAFNPRLSILGVVLSDVKVNRVLTTEVTQKVEEIFGDVVFETKLRNYVAIAESPLSGQSVIDYAPGSNAAQDFTNFAKEFLVKYNNIK